MIWYIYIYNLTILDPKTFWCAQSQPHRGTSVEHSGLDGLGVSATRHAEHDEPRCTVAICSHLYLASPLRLRRGLERARWRTKWDEFHGSLRVICHLYLHILYLHHLSICIFIFHFFPGSIFEMFPFLFFRFFPHVPLIVSYAVHMRTIHSLSAQQNMEIHGIF